MNAAAELWNPCAVFVIPHNFLAPIVPKMEGAFAKGAIGCSLIKGIEFEKGGEFKPSLIRCSRQSLCPPDS